jgi:hypothetical protein
MTAEIAVLNKFGVALAADSAITVDHFHNGEIKTKVYNTANKLFSLSKFDPVGIMFYNTVTISGVPWETVIKAYRSELKDRRFDSLSEHRQEFFRWLDSGPYVFSDAHTANSFENNLYREFARVVAKCKNKTQFKTTLEKEIGQLEKTESIDLFDDKLASMISKTYDKQITSAMQYMINKPSWAIGLRSQVKRFVSLLSVKKRLFSSYSGLVIAGFGAKESLPSLEEYYVDSILCGKVRYWQKGVYKIDEDNQSHVVPLADSEAMKTLIEGISPTFRLELFAGALKLLMTVPASIMANITEITDERRKEYLQASEKEIPALFRKFVQDMADFRNTTYTFPIRQSLASLPISELGVVAEAFLGASQVLKR